jgi:hypothetical protein
MSTISFSIDILPLFNKETDVPHMAKVGVMLADYAYMSVPANAQIVLNHLDGTTPPIMPPRPAQPWSDANIALFRAWIAGGFQP